MMEKTPKTVDLILKNAKIFVDQQIFEGGIAVDDGKIIKISKGSKLPAGDKVIDINRRLIIPGVIDIHAHLRDLNYRGKEDFYTGTCAAANGGITSVVDMPNTNPPTISSQLMREKMAVAKKKIVVNTGFYAGIPNKLEEIDSFKDLGIFGFKLYLSHSLSQFNILDQELIRNLFQKVKSTHYPILIHAERKQDIETFKAQNKEKVKTPQELYLKSHSETVEKRAIEFIFELNTPIEAPIHICHVSTAPGVEIIGKMKKLYKNITAEVTPHHLLLNTGDLEKQGAFAKMLPPLRTSKDQEALWGGLNHGIIDIVATDHAPHKLSEKECDFSNASNGIPGFETFVPMLFTAMHKRKIDLASLIQVLSKNPSKFLNLPKKGKIVVGFDADLTIIDLNKEDRIKSTNFYSKAKFSPFDGHTVRGIPVMTIINGEIVMKDHEILVQRGSGKIIHRLQN